MPDKLEKLEAEMEQLRLTTSHTKRTSMENGKKIKEVHDTVSKLWKEWVIVTDRLTGEEGYFKRVRDIEKDVELHEIKLNKSEIRQIKLLVFAITAGLICGWLISQYRMVSKKDDSTTYFKREEVVEMKRFSING